MYFQLANTSLARSQRIVLELGPLRSRDPRMDVPRECVKRPLQLAYHTDASQPWRQTQQEFCKRSQFHLSRSAKMVRAIPLILTIGVVPAYARARSVAGCRLLPLTATPCVSARALLPAALLWSSRLHRREVSRGERVKITRPLAFVCSQSKETKEKASHVTEVRVRQALPFLTLTLLRTAGGPQEAEDEARYPGVSFENRQGIHFARGRLHADRFRLPRTQDIESGDDACKS